MQKTKGTQMQKKQTTCKTHGNKKAKKGNRHFCIFSFFSQNFAQQFRQSRSISGMRYYFKILLTFFDKFRTPARRCPNMPRCCRNASTSTYIQFYICTRCPNMLKQCENGCNGSTAMCIDADFVRGAQIC